MDGLIALARRHVQQCAELVSRQEELVQNLRQSGRETAEAEILLAHCRRALAEREAYLSALLDES